MNLEASNAISERNSTPAVRASKLSCSNVLMMPDYERAGIIGQFWAAPRSKEFAELLMLREEEMRRG